MGTIFKPTSIVTYHSVASLAELLRCHIDAGAREGTIITAHEQRNNYLPHGGLWFSFYVEPVLTREELPLIPLVTSLAIVDTLRECAGITAHIRWPKEVVVDGKKIADVHCHIDASGLSGLRMVKTLISVAINTNLTFQNLPEKITSKVTSVQLLRSESNHEYMLAKFCTFFEQYYSQLHKNAKKDIIGKYCEILTTLHKEVVVTTSNREETGRAVAIEDDGSLLFQTAEGVIKKVASSDVLFGNIIS